MGYIRLNYKAPKTHWTAFKDFLFQIFPASPGSAVVDAPSILLCEGFLSVACVEGSCLNLNSLWVAWVDLLFKISALFNTIYCPHSLPPPLPIIKSLVWVKLTKIVKLWFLSSHFVTPFWKQSNASLLPWQFINTQSLRDFSPGFSMERCP